jgi:anti-sigma factor RsiW
MPDCRKMKSRLGRYCDGELPPIERRLVEDHLKRCRQCGEELQAIRAIAGAFQEGMWVPPVPSALNQRIMAKARVQVSNAPSAWSFLGFWKNWSFSMRLAAMGVVAAACYVGLAIGSSSQPLTRSTGAEMKWIGMTSQGPIVKAYMGSNR